MVYVVFDDCDVIVRYVVVKNIGNEPLYIDELNVSLSGKYLRTVGLVVRELGDFESFVCYFSTK